MDVPFHVAPKKSSPLRSLVVKALEPTVRMDDGMAYHVRAEVFLNASCLISRIVEGREIVLRAVHPLNILLPTYMSPSAKATLTNYVHPANIPFPVPS